jgi:hypothetical protein
VVELGRACHAGEHQHGVDLRLHPGDDVRVHPAQRDAKSA